MGLKITDFRVSTLLDTSVADVASYPMVFGIDGYVDGDGWAGWARDDDGDSRLTFKTIEEAEAKIAELRRQFA
ncbi:hypothetical protein [Methylobacterium sp. CM6247]